jgi:hypothetical protein
VGSTLGLNLVGLVRSPGPSRSIIKGEGLHLYGSFDVFSVFQIKMQMFVNHFKVRHSLSYFRIESALVYAIC